MQLKWKTKYFYPLCSSYPESHKEKKLLRLFSKHLEAFLFKVWITILPFHPLFLLKWWCSGFTALLCTEKGGHKLESEARMCQWLLLLHGLCFKLR